MIIGRKDYVLRSVHPQASLPQGWMLWRVAAMPFFSCLCEWVCFSAALQFGLQWNVTWGRINRLSELEMYSVQEQGGHVRFHF